MKNQINETEIKQEVKNIITTTQKITITTAADMQISADYLRNIKTAQKRIIDFFAPLKKSAHETWKKIVASEKELIDPLNQVEINIKRKVAQYTQEQERIRQEEQRRLQAKADEQARREREALEKKAVRLKTPEKKEALLEQAEMVAAPVIQLAPEKKPEGISTREIWKAKIINESSVPREFLIVNQKALDAFARSTKGKIKVSGVEFYSEKSVAVNKL